MPLVEPPTIDHWQPGAVHGVKRVPQRVRSALEHAGVGNVKIVARFQQQLARVFGLCNTGVGQRHIGPAGKAVFQIPGGFAVADKYEFVHKKDVLEA